MVDRVGRARAAPAGSRVAPCPRARGRRRGRGRPGESLGTISREGGYSGTASSRTPGLTRADDMPSLLKSSPNFDPRSAWARDGWAPASVRYPPLVRRWLRVHLKADVDVTGQSYGASAVCRPFARHVEMSGPPRWMPGRSSPRDHRAQGSLSAIGSSAAGLDGRSLRRSGCTADRR